MNKPAVLSQAAMRDVDEIHSYYAGISDLLAEGFIIDLQHALEYIGNFAQASQLFHAPYRRYVMQHFPYILFFRIKGDETIVSLVSHQHRNPLHWQKRLH